MRFSALLYKELRECLPWMLLAAIVFLAVSSILLRIEPYNEYNEYYSHRYSRFSPGSIVREYDLTSYPILKSIGPWLFLLHRSVSRNTILCAKVSAALIAFVCSIVPIWLGIYWYATRPEVSAVPPTPRVFIEGWIFIILGFVTYLGTALSGLSTTKWYTTKIFGILFVFAIFITLSMWTLAGFLVALIVSAAILLIQIFQTFGGREF